MDSIDTSWCPVCDRQIIPKRYLVPVAPPPPLAPAPPPCSPSSPAKDHEPTTTRVTRSKGGTIRARAGLVHGTGRVKPNGALKRTDSFPKPASPPAPPAKPTAPVRYRTVIDQGPAPLYCSDECQMADLASFQGLPLSYDPARHTCDNLTHTSPVLPPVPHNSFSDSSSSDDSIASVSSVSSVPSSAYSGYDSPSIATLATIYNFPPLPPPPPLLSRNDSTSSVDSDVPLPYDSGVMMASRRIAEALAPPAAPKRPSMLVAPNSPTEERRGRQVIPGWTDGSDAWRASVYSLSPPRDGSHGHCDSPSAYKSYAASPHRSHGVFSTFGESSSALSTPQAVQLQYSTSSTSSSSESLYSKYALSFSRERRSASLEKQSQSLPRRTRPLVKPGAEGRLLVPNVMLSVSSSLSSGGSYAASSKRSFRSPPLTRWGSEVSENSMLSRVEEEGSKRATAETRSWSYDNVATYPVMPLPPRKEKRRERRVVNGAEVEVEVEVEIIPERKRLFLFPGKETSVERR